MLLDVKLRIDEETIQDLLSLAITPDDPDRLRNAVEGYKGNDADKLIGYDSEGRIIGVIGYRFLDNYTIELKHLAVIPEERGKGYGRGLILELLELEKPHVLIAETDEEAVEFYRSNGFTIESLGEKHPGVERFKCTFVADDEE